MTNIKKSVVAGTIVGLVIAIYFSVKIHLISGLFIGLCYAIFIGIISYFKFFSKMDEYSGDFTKIESSTIIYKGAASHFKDGISVGGTLFLLDSRLIFQSNLINFMKRHEKIIEIENITSISPEDSYTLFSNGLSIVTNEEIDDFIVNKRNIWIDHIKNKMPVV